MTAALQHDVRLASRALARHGLVHAYGHVSARMSASAFLVSPAHPLDRVKEATELVMCSVEGDLAPGALPEVRMHQAIYRARPDVGGICRFQSPKLMSLSVLRKTPRALHGLGAYFAPAPPLWDDPALVRDVERAEAVAAMLGGGRGIVLRGNGAVTVGDTIREAAAHAFSLEDAARVEIDILGHAPAEYTADQAARRAAGDKQLYARMWEFMVGDDAEEEQR